ncbi:ankyrin repeat domain-containing protein [bacterium]|nr:ankyrin repeat domain-containing protein [bacterium]
MKLFLLSLMMILVLCSCNPQPDGAEHSTAGAGSLQQEESAAAEPEEPQVAEEGGQDTNPDAKPLRGYSERELSTFANLLDEDPGEARRRLQDEGAVLDSDHLIDYIELGRTVMVVRMIAAGIDLNAPASNGKRPLAEAVLQNDPYLLELMLEHGADPLLSDDPEKGTGRSLLHYATKMDNAELVERLLELGIAADITDANDQTPLDVAATYGMEQSLQLLLDHGADPQRQDRGGSVPILLAGGYGRTGAARLLLAHGADINYQHERGWTPLLLAIYYDHIETAGFLLDNGADISASLQTGYGAAGIAAMLGDPQMLELVLDSGAATDSLIEESGRNLIHLCAMNNLSAFIERLAADGVDPGLEDAEGRTPLILARDAADEEAMRILSELTGVSIDDLPPPDAELPPEAESPEEPVADSGAH